MPCGKNEFFANFRSIVIFVLLRRSRYSPNTDKYDKKESNEHRRETRMIPSQTLQAKEFSMSHPGAFRYCIFCTLPARYQARVGQRDNDSCRQDEIAKSAGMTH